MPPFRKGITHNSRHVVQTCQFEKFIERPVYCMPKAIKQRSSQCHKQIAEHVKGLLNRKPPDTLDILPKGVGHLQERLIGENEVIRDLCKAAMRYAEDRHRWWLPCW